MCVLPRAEAVLSPARPRYGQQAIISIRGFGYAMPAQAKRGEGRGTSGRILPESGRNECAAVKLLDTNEILPIG
jgi:hypothetical protein